MREFTENFSETSHQEQQAELPPRCDDAITNKKIDENIDIDRIIENLSILGNGDKEHQRELVRSLTRLVIELKEQLPHYDTILSDDASGRLVSLFLREIINRKKAESKKTPVQTFFIAGGRGSDMTSDAIDKFITKEKPSLGKTLLVTEYMKTGESINYLVEKLEKQEVNFDVASLSISDEFLDDHIRGKNDEIKNLIKRLKYGDKNEIGLHVFYAKPFTGIKKGQTRETSAHPSKNPHHKQVDIRKARLDIQLLADEISKLA
ncbi:MAG: hypothetical protein Q8M83_03765 [bacterium]|nr:hypothetical protein [bacterium]